MANAGIMHLSFKQGGRPFCNTRRSIMSTTPDLADSWPRICGNARLINVALMREKAKPKDDPLFAVDGSIGRELRGNSWPLQEAAGRLRLSTMASAVKHNGER